MSRAFSKNGYILFLLLLLSVCALSSSVAYAALNAGVVNGVWFSNPNPEEGEEIRIFTAVQNTSNETVAGTVAFLVNGDIAGTAKFTAQTNDVVAVSIPFTFSDGAYDVSAYITSSQDESVAYTIAQETSVSVAKRKAVETETQENSPVVASTTAVAEDVVEAAKDTLARVTPVAESAAKRVEDFRDSLLEEKTKSTDAPTVTNTPEPVETKTFTKKEAAQHFVEDSKAISTSVDIPLWKKVVGVMLSGLALLLRFWFVLVVLVVGLVFWLLVRGRRIV